MNRKNCFLSWCCGLKQGKIATSWTFSCHQQLRHNKAHVHTCSCTKHFIKDFKWLPFEALRKKKLFPNFLRHPCNNESLYYGNNLVLWVTWPYLRLYINKRMKWQNVHLFFQLWITKLSSPFIHRRQHSKPSVYLYPVSSYMQHTMYLKKKAALAS